MGKQPNQNNRARPQRKIAQDQFIDALLQHPTIKAAAQSVGISEMTARRYLDDPAFKAAYEQAKEQVRVEARNGLTSLVNKAVEGLNKLIDDPECPHATRVRAYQMIFDRDIPLSSEQQQPLQGNTLTDPFLVQHLTGEELDELTQIMERAQARKAEAEGKPNTSAQAAT